MYFDITWVRPQQTQSINEGARRALQFPNEKGHVAHRLLLLLHLELWPKSLQSMTACVCSECVSKRASSFSLRPRVSTTVATRQTKAARSLLPAASGPTDTAQVAGAGAARATTVLVAFFFPSEVQLAPPPWALSRLETRPNGLSNDHSCKQPCEAAQNALEIACFTPGQSPA